MPYQLHCEAHTCCCELDDEEGTEDGVDDGTEDGTDEGTDGTEEDERTDDGVEEVVLPPQTAPLIVGISADCALFLLTWIPKATVWPGWIVPFQPRLVAV